MKQELLQYKKPEESSSFSEKLGIHSHNILNKIFKYDIRCEPKSLREFYEETVKLDNRWSNKSYTSFFDDLLFLNSIEKKDKITEKYVILKDPLENLSLRFTIIHPYQRDYYSVSRDSWNQIDSLKRADRVKAVCSWWDEVPYLLYIKKQEDYHKKGKEKIIIPDFPSQLINLSSLKDKRKKELVLR